MAFSIASARTATPSSTSCCTYTGVAPVNLICQGNLPISAGSHFIPACTNTLATLRLNVFPPTLDTHFFFLSARLDFSSRLCQAQNRLRAAPCVRPRRCVCSSCCQDGLKAACVIVIRRRSPARQARSLRFHAFGFYCSRRRYQNQPPCCYTCIRLNSIRKLALFSLFVAGDLPGAIWSKAVARYVFAPAAPRIPAVFLLPRPTTHHQKA